MLRTVVIRLLVVGLLIVMYQTELADASAPVQTDSPNAFHPRAGRSAFPERGERLTQPIPAKRLSSEDPFAKPGDTDDTPKLVPWDQAHLHMNEQITVEGTVVHLGQSRDGNVNFLNFDANWRGKFYLVIFNDLAQTLDRGIDRTFKNKTVRVTGKVEDHRGSPQMKILSMDQVQFVEQ